MNRKGRETRAVLWLGAGFAVLIVALFVVLGAVAYIVVAAGQREAAAEAVLAASRIDSPGDAPAGVLVTIVRDGVRMSSPLLPRGLPDIAALQKAATSGAVTERTQTLDGRRYLVRTSTQGTQLIQVAYNLHEQAEETGRLLTALGVAGSLAILAAGTMAIFLARWSLRPLGEALAIQHRFVADAGHELRTPLTLLSTRAQILRHRVRADPGEGDSDADRALREGLDEIVSDTQGLSRIIDDLLTIAEFGSARSGERLDLASLARDVAHTMRTRSGRQGVTIQVSASSPAFVVGSPVALRRLILALVDNAVDHAETSVRLDVTLRRRWVRLRVQDDGPGFADPGSRRVFERFVSARADKKEAGPRHYGIGLALVAGIVGRHDGTVKADNSGPDGGASVTVRLPTAGRETFLGVFSRGIRTG